MLKSRGLIWEAVLVDGLCNIEIIYESGTVSRANGKMLRCVLKKLCIHMLLFLHDCRLGSAPGQMRTLDDTGMGSC